MEIVIKFFLSFLRHSIVHSDIKFIVFYSQPLECWDYSIVSPFLERERDHMCFSSLLLQSWTEIEILPRHEFSSYFNALLSRI